MLKCQCSLGLVWGRKGLWNAVQGMLAQAPSKILSPLLLNCSELQFIHALRCIKRVLQRPAPLASGLCKFQRRCPHPCKDASVASSHDIMCILALSQFLSKCCKFKIFSRDVLKDTDPCILFKFSTTNILNFCCRSCTLKQRPLFRAQQCHGLQGGTQYLDL